MGTQQQSGFQPRGLDREHATQDGGKGGAKLLYADWPTGIKGTARSLLASVGRFSGWCLGVAEQTVKGEQIADGSGLTPAQLHLADQLDTGRWPSRPLRIGLRVGNELSRRVRESAGSGGVQFVFVASTIGDRAACVSLNLDAMLIPSATGMKIQTREYREREAGWFDWGTHRPLSYMSVFPSRLDVAQVTIEDVSAQSPETEVTLIRALAEAAAVSSRMRARLTLDDRWRGRKAIDHAGVLDEAMSRVATVLHQASLGTIRSAHRAAARVLSAWAISDRGTGFSSRQRHLAELCARCAGQEAEVMLRLATARLADMDDVGGKQTLLAGDRMLRSRAALPGVDNSAFVQAELDQGRRDPLSVGRVAAGVVIACASLPVEKLVFTQNDLLDEMRFTQWLVGRDQDRTLLHHLIRELVFQRRAEQLGLPPAPSKLADAMPVSTESNEPVTSAAPKSRAKKGTRSKSRAAAKAAPGPKTKRSSKAAPRTAKPRASRRVDDPLPPRDADATRRRKAA